MVILGKSFTYSFSKHSLCLCHLPAFTGAVSTPKISILHSVIHLITPIYLLIKTQPRGVTIQETITHPQFDLQVPTLCSHSALCLSVLYQLSSIYCCCLYVHFLHHTQSFLRKALSLSLWISVLFVFLGPFFPLGNCHSFIPCGSAKTVHSALPTCLQHAWHVTQVNAGSISSRQQWLP